MANKFNGLCEWVRDVRYNVTEEEDFIAQEKTMAEETQEERDARWAAYRAQREALQRQYQTVRARTRKKYVLIGVAIVIIVAVIAAIMVL
jgi:hypothetical protein